MAAISRGRLARSVSSLTVHRRDDVAALETALVGGATLLHLGHKGPVAPLKPHGLSDLGSHALNRDPEPAARDRTLVLKLRHDIP